MKTHISTQKDVAVMTMQTIIDMLRWTEQEYADFKYQQGIAYLRWYMPADEHTIQSLLRNRLFWNWWKSCWNNRDEVFVANCALDMQLSKGTIRTMYKHLHDAKGLAMEIRPGKTVLMDALKDRPVLTLKEVHQ